MLDHAFILECYADWPITSVQGPITADDVKRFIVRWMNHRGGERCLIDEHGLITWRQNLFVAVVDNIVVHPESRGAGKARRMWQLLQETLVNDGVVVAEFKAIPGPIADKVMRGDFEKVSEGIGEKSGLPIITGRVTADMEI